MAFLTLFRPLNKTTKYSDETFINKLLNLFKDIVSIRK